MAVPASSPLSALSILLAPISSLFSPLSSLLPSALIFSSLLSSLLAPRSFSLLPCGCSHCQHRQHSVGTLLPFQQKRFPPNKRNAFPHNQRVPRQLTWSAMRWPGRTRTRFSTASRRLHTAPWSASSQAVRHCLSLRLCFQRLLPFLALPLPLPPRTDAFPCAPSQAVADRKPQV